TKGLSLVSVFETGLDAGVDQPDGTGSDAETPVIQGGHGDLKPFPFFSYPILHRNPHFFHKNFPGIPRSDAQFMLKSTSRNTRKASLHNKTGDATMPLVRGGFREDQKVIGHIAEGDPGFASIENVVVSVTNSRGLDGSHVGAD